MKLLFMLFFSLTFLLPAEVEPLKLKSIHPEWRREYSPHNRTAINNPPVLFSPTTRDNWKMAFQLHDFEISRQQDFSDISFKADDLKQSFFIPTKLEKGQWFWRIRINKGNWSEIWNFTIDESSWVNEAPKAELFVQSIPMAHPRVLARKSRLAELRREMNNNPQRKLIQKHAELYIGVELPDKEWAGKFYKNGARVLQNKKFPADHPKSQPNGTVFKAALHSLCMAFIVSGDEKYCKEAIRWGMAAAKLSVFRDERSEAIYNIQDSFSYAAILEGLVQVFDTCHDYFTPEEIETVQHSLHTRADTYFRYFCNRLESRIIDNHSWQHTYLSFLEAA
ncbi:MAG: DUF4962 domain-containing protein, partial [Lentisphaeraceae bacterium]|nr:DUF4962 domain-containing protein [Lentisphaeraceae bacterium]